MRKYYLKLGWRGRVNSCHCSNSNSKRKNKILLILEALIYPQATYPRIFVALARHAKAKAQRREMQL